jgi:hypothetical protein
MLLAEAAGHVLGIPGMGVLTKVGGETGGKGMEKILTDALMDPQRLRELLDRSFDLSIVSPRAQMIRNALRLAPLAGYEYLSSPEQPSR